MSANVQDKQAQVAKIVPIEWPDADVAVYANNLLAVCDGNAFYLTFCQTHPPIIMGTEEEKTKQLAQINGIKARPVARVVVSASTLRDIVQVLQQQISILDGKRTDNVDMPNT